MVILFMAGICEASRGTRTPHSSASLFAVAVPGRECQLSLSHPDPDAELAETGAGRWTGAEHRMALMARSVLAGGGHGA
jgi:hypothetical protein